MNPVTLGMDALLAVLLLAAVAVGLRLNGKLKVLRESQAGFVKAVGELDLAAGRAEAGLAALRTATQEAHDQLLTRIEAARGLSTRLDEGSGRAADAVARLDAAVQGAEVAARRARIAPVPATTPELPPVQATPGPAGLRAALLAAERIVEAEVAAPTPGGLARPEPSAPAPRGPAGDRLARFVARRQGARA